MICNCCLFIYCNFTRYEFGRHAIHCLFLVIISESMSMIFDIFSLIFIFLFQSFIKKMTGRVTGLIGWNTSSQSAVSQNHDDLSSSTDEDNISPTPKRMRVQSDPEDTLLSFIPNANKGKYGLLTNIFIMYFVILITWYIFLAINEACSPIQPVNDINPAEPNQQNACLVSSTPASARSSTHKNISTPAKTGTTHQPHNLGN